jgi:hypothetical protein
MTENKSFIKKLELALEVIDKSRIKAKKRPDMVNRIAKHLPISYRIKAAPIQILDYDHPLNEVSENIKMFKTISEGGYHLLHKCPEGELRFYQQVIALVDEAEEKPIKFFYVFFPTAIDGEEAIQNFYMWRDKSINTKIDGLSLRNYCIFKVLLPNVNIIISAEKHTEAGENASKSLLREALKRQLYVYYTTEKGDLKRFFDLKDVDTNFWGTTETHGKRLTIISDHELNDD